MTRKKIKTSGAVVYVGPSIQHGLLPAHTIFKDGTFPPAVQALRDKSPALRGLFLPVSRLADARIRIRKKGDILNTFASRLKDELKEG